MSIFDTTNKSRPFGKEKGSKPYETALTNVFPKNAKYNLISCLLKYLIWLIDGYSENVNLTTDSTVLSRSTNYTGSSRQGSKVLWTVATFKSCLYTNWIYDGYKVLQI